jgi:hypothetical protein
MPAATLRPVLPSMLTGCSEIVLLEPPISTLAPAPTPTVALSVALKYAGRLSENAV